MSLSCPGLYCGRVILTSNGNLTTFSSCGSCPQGFRTNGSICLPCDEPISIYDSLYISFIVLLVLFVHVLSIHLTVKPILFRMTLSASAALETLLAIVCTVAIFTSLENFSLNSCGVQSLQDWYPIFENPPGYHCAYEVVYPLWSLPIVFYAFGVLAVLCIRIFVSLRYCCGLGSASIYVALYLFPLLTLVQIILGGLLCKQVSLLIKACLLIIFYTLINSLLFGLDYAFPYILLVAAFLLELVLFGVNFRHEHFFRKPRNLILLGVIYGSMVFASVWIMFYYSSNLNLITVAFMGPVIPIGIFLLVRRSTRYRIMVR